MTFPRHVVQWDATESLTISTHPVESSDYEKARNIAAYEGEVRLFGVVVFTHRVLAHHSAPMDRALEEARLTTGAAFAERLRGLLGGLSS